MAETSEASCSLHERLNTPHKMCVCPKVRTVGSNRALVVFAWTYLVYVSGISILYTGEVSNLHVHQIHIRGTTIGFSAATLLGPVAGLVASVYFGRYKVMYASLWFMWSGAIAIAIAVAMLKVLPEAQQGWLYAGEIIGVALYVFGLTAFTVNSVPFGLDQMPDASSEQITAFIHWYTWSALAGVATATLLDTVFLYCVHPSSTPQYTSLASATVLTLALCSCFLLHQWLIIEPESKNPLKTIFKVLRFAAKHKVPVRRSAFTYWEPGIPSRIDLGKSKYGGPFTNEEVEDVKTCLRMLVVLCSISVTFSSFTAYVTSTHTGYLIMLNHQSTYWGHSLQLNLPNFIFCMALSPPVHDVVIYPIVRKCRPSTLKRVSLVQTLLILLQLIALSVSIVWYKVASPDHCLLVSGTGLSPLSVYYAWIEIPSRLATTVLCLFFFTAMLEFVCAQAPYNLRGLLVGMLPSVAVLSALVGAVIHIIWRQAYKHQGSSGSMCGIWFYLFTTITAILGCMIWCVVAKWYKKREREEVDMCRIFAENYYDH